MLSAIIFPSYLPFLLGDLLPKETVFPLPLSSLCFPVGYVSRAFYLPPSSFVVVLFFHISGVGAKRLPTATRVQRLCLRNLWMAIPREPPRSHVPVTAKALLPDLRHLQFKTKGFCAVIVGPIWYCACVIKYKSREHQPYPQIGFQWAGDAYLPFVNKRCHHW